MKTKAIYFLMSLILLIGFSCGESGDNEFYEPESKLDYMLPSGEGSALEQKSAYTPPEKEKITEIKDTDKSDDTDETINIEKQIIRTANISFGVSDYKTSKANIDTIVLKYKGFIASENEYNSSYNISNTIIIRVPAENFFQLMADLEGEAEEFESKSINTSDVTEEYVDILTRLKNKKKVEAQYLEILKKARTIAEILEVNEHIRVLREEIESAEGRLRYLKNQVGLSTITLNIHQDYDTVSYGFFRKIGDALAGGWEGLLAFFIGLIYLWPLLIIGFVIFYFVRKRIRKRRQQKQGK